jgi:hypothetical protein
VSRSARFLSALASTAVRYHGLERWALPLPAAAAARAEEARRLAALDVRLKLGLAHMAPTASAASGALSVVSLGLPASPASVEIEQDNAAGLRAAFRAEVARAASSGGGGVGGGRWALLAAQAWPGLGRDQRALLLQVVLLSN